MSGNFPILLKILFRGIFVLFIFPPVQLSSAEWEAGYFFDNNEVFEDNPLNPDKIFAELPETRNTIYLSTQFKASANYTDYLYLDGLAYWNDDGDEKDRALFKELYGKVVFGPVSFFAGKRILNWSSALLFEPGSTYIRSEKSRSLERYFGKYHREGGLMIGLGLKPGIGTVDLVLAEMRDETAENNTNTGNQFLFRWLYETEGADFSLIHRQTRDKRNQSGINLSYLPSDSTVIYLDSVYRNYTPLDDVIVLSEERNISPNISIPEIPGTAENKDDSYAFEIGAGYTDENNFWRLDLAYCFDSGGYDSAEYETVKDYLKLSYESALYRDERFETQQGNPYRGFLGSMLKKTLSANLRQNYFAVKWVDGDLFEDWNPEITVYSNLDDSSYYILSDIRYFYKSWELVLGYLDYQGDSYSEYGMQVLDRRLRLQANIKF